MVFTHLLLILRCAEVSLVRHRQTVFASLGSTAAMNEGISRGFFLTLGLHILVTF